MEQDLASAYVLFPEEVEHKGMMDLEQKETKGTQHDK